MKKTTVVLSVLAAALLSRAELAIIAPKPNETVPLLTGEQKAYLVLPRDVRHVKFADAAFRKGGLGLPEEKGGGETRMAYWPKTVRLAWTAADGVSYRVRVTDADKGEVVYAGETKGGEVSIDNLEIAAEYEWTVTGAGEEARGRFRTEDLAPRLVRFPGVPNVRDLGGRIGLDGRRVKQGMVFRSAGLNDNASSNCVPGRTRVAGANGDYIRKRFGIRSDIDLRSDGECRGMTGSPLGDSVTWFHYSSSAYAGMPGSRGKKAFESVFRVFLDERNYPIDFHCIAGQDRTGAVAFILNALLGVAEEELWLDWEATGFWNRNAGFRHERFDGMIEAFRRSYPAPTLRESCEKYVRDIGFTDTDIVKVRSILLEERPLAVSLFASDVQRVMRQLGVTLGEAARLLKGAGVSGYDCDFSDPKIPLYSKTLLKPVNFYGSVDFCSPDGGVGTENALIAAAVSNCVPRIMVIPTGFAEGPEAETRYGKIRDGLRRLAKKALKVGVVPTVEDYGGTNNICSRAGYVRRLLKDVPDLRFALDSGNLYYAGRGEDILELMRFAGARIAHVHLKDQTTTNNHAYASLGTGAVPNEAIVKYVAARGYDRWFTLENPVGPDFFGDVRRQISVLRAWHEAGRTEGPGEDPRPHASGGTLDVSFARGKWKPDDFIVVKSPRWTYVHAFEQRDDAIVNPCPDVSGEDVQKKHCADVYAAMVYRERFGFGCTVSSTMAYDYRMAPIIVLAPGLGKSADGVPEFREHWEVCLYDEGINVWHHFHDGAKASWRCAAAIRLKNDMRFRPDVRHRLNVATSRKGGHKRMTVTCGDAELSYFDDSLPDSFYVGVLGCEGRNFFYDLKVR